MSTPLRQDLVNFVVHEARLVDEQRFDEWLDLFAEDGRYWMPLEYGQTDPVLHNNLFYDDKLLLRIRIERLKGAKTYSQKPKSRCHHLLQAPLVESIDESANRYSTSKPAPTSRCCSPAGPGTRWRCWKAGCASWSSAWTW